MFIYGNYKWKPMDSWWRLHNVEYSKIENDVPEDIKITSGGKGKLYIFSIQIKSV